MTCRELVADSSDCPQHPRPVCLQLAAQRADIDLNEIGVVGVVSPYRGQDLILAHRSAALFDEVTEQLKLRGSEIQHCTGSAHHATLYIQDQVTDLHGRRYSASPPQ